MENEDKTFSYTYSAKQQKEIEAIRRKYLPPEEDKMERLRKLDRKATDTACAVSIALGVISALVLGCGMCCCLVWEMYFLGIIVGALGIIGVIAAYPMYNRILKRERGKVAPEVLRLTDELMK